jgi:hypothetical protein
MSTEKTAGVVKVSLPRDLLEKAAKDLGLTNIDRLPAHINLVAVPETQHLQTRVGHVPDLVVVR